MKIGYVIDILTIVDIHEIVKIGGRVIQLYEGVIYRKNFERSLLGKVLENLFAVRQKYKYESNDLMQGLVKLFMNSLYGVPIRKDINELCKCKSQQWMETEYDHNVLNFWKLPNGRYIKKIKERRWFRWC